MKLARQFALALKLTRRADAQILSLTGFVLIDPAGVGVSLDGETQKHMQPMAAHNLLVGSLCKFCDRWPRKQARWLVLF